MKIIHIESGLGNQMLSYCELLALRQANPNDDFYIETIVYEITECNKTICQWNGYELEHVFGINEKNIKTQFSESEWNEIIQEIRQSRFWEKNWNWPVYFTRVFNKHGLNIENAYGDREAAKTSKTGQCFEKWFFNSVIGNHIWRRLNGIRESKYVSRENNDLYRATDSNLLAGQTLRFKLRDYNIERIHNDILRSFVFHPFVDKKDVDFAGLLGECNAVAIHARRGDMLSANGWCYRYGYFKRAVSYIKNHVDKPVFVFFTDPGSIEWCKDNSSIFGLDFSKDKIFFVDWHKGEDSYRDMQLMSYCKHAIITNSSFGWWGAYMIPDPEKITISPSFTINTTRHIY